MTSILYWHPFLYETAMRLLYGRGFEGRYQELVKWIPAGASVYDACAGDCRLYLKYLKPLGSVYRAGDFNEHFVAHGRKHGIAMDLLDLRKDTVPASDVVILQASLYQFLPHVEPLLERLAASARRRLILSEPVRNLATSTNPILARIGKLGTGTKDQSHPLRFSEESVTNLVERMFGKKVLHSQLIAAGREKLFCIATEN